MCYETHCIIINHHRKNTQLSHSALKEIGIIHELSLSEYGSLIPTTFVILKCDLQGIPILQERRLLCLAYWPETISGVSSSLPF
jgi:hypothetical protein